MIRDNLLAYVQERITSTSQGFMARNFLKESEILDKVYEDDVVPFETHVEDVRTILHGLAQEGKIREHKRPYIQKRGIIDSRFDGPLYTLPDQKPYQVPATGKKT